MAQKEHERDEREKETATGQPGNSNEKEMPLPRTPSEADAVGSVIRTQPKTLLTTVVSPRTIPTSTADCRWNNCSSPHVR